MNASKLCYILPEAAVNTHMKYNVEFLRELSLEIDIFLIVEKGASDLDENVGAIRYVNYKNQNLNSLIRIYRTYKLVKEAKNKGYKKYYVHYSFVAALIASIVPGIKVYYWNCGLPWNYKRKFYVDWYQGLTYKLIDYFVTGSYNLGLEYADHYKFIKSKILEVPNWINLREFQNKMLMASREDFRIANNIPDDARVMFYMQRLSERKGAHYLPTILSNVPSNVYLVIAGDGPYKETLEQKFKDLNLGVQVRMLGRVPNEMMASIFKSVDIFLLPSEEEGMAHALLEAMASGTPSVAFDVGATKDMYPSDYRSYVVEAKNINNFIAKVNYLLQNKLDSNLLGQSLKDAVIKFDKQKVLNDFKSKIVYN